MAISMMTRADLTRQSRLHAGTGAVSPANRSMGFEPAFLDRDTGRVYRSRFRNGSPAAFHLLDGLPETLVLRHATSGRALAVKATVVAGFLCNGRFYTRDAASHLAARGPDVSAVGVSGRLRASLKKCIGGLLSARRRVGRQPGV